MVAIWQERLLALNYAATTRRGRFNVAEALEKNLILQGLDAASAALIYERGDFVEFGLRERVHEANRAITSVVFPLGCVISVVTRMKDGTQIEVGTIGREGMSAIPLLLGANTTANESYCQVRGGAFKISAELFSHVMRTDPSFRKLLDRYLQAYVNMLGQLTACNRRHSVYERCARWLLMTHDRVDVEEIPLTHEFLAMMLGTGRSGVTIAAATLQHAGFIRYSHGLISIRDRQGLESAACECYEVAHAQFGGLLRRVAETP